MYSTVYVGSYSEYVTSLMHSFVCFVCRTLQCTVFLPNEYKVIVSKVDNTIQYCCTVPTRYMHVVRVTIAVNDISFFTQKSYYP